MTKGLNSSSQNILTSLIELNQWEWFNVPILNSVIGRHVYFSIATELLNKSEQGPARSLKQVLNHPGYTERAIRLKLREMEHMGFIASVYSHADKRVRFLVPTPKLVELIENHARFYQSLLDKKFIVLEK
jgi:DNA-binding MarR family transcriptional regulator